VRDRTNWPQAGGLGRVLSGGGEVGIVRPTREAHHEARAARIPARRGEAVEVPDRVREEGRAHYGAPTNEGHEALVLAAAWNGARRAWPLESETALDVVTRLVPEHVHAVPRERRHCC